MTGSSRAFRYHVKSTLGRLICMSGMHALRLRDYATVLAFHRISEGPGKDSLTLSRDTFRDWCSFLSRHFQVVPLSLIRQKLEDGEHLDRELAITFDDGYMDNYEFAAPVLKDHDLPATFFVTTGFIETEYVPWWDRKIGARFEWMTWEHVRGLHRMGFEIGSHTVTHADLGKIPRQEALKELIDSRTELEERLSAPVAHFAHPYGAPENITEDNRNLVKDAGYSCCCSCFGGINPRGTDPYRLLRIPISSWYRSTYDFLFQLSMHRV